MPSRFNIPQEPKQPDPDSRVDVSKRYDVYCSRHNQEPIVYRNVLFKGSKTLFSSGNFDIISQFLELEHPNGDRVFISRHGIMGFCEHGKNLGADLVRER
jgi:hypothetical protein